MALFAKSSDLNLGLIPGRLSYEFCLHFCVGQPPFYKSPSQIASTYFLLFRLELLTLEAAFSLLKVHKIEIFFGFNFEICIISFLVTSKY
jgi:hypothetical protein